MKIFTLINKRKIKNKRSKMLKKKRKKKKRSN